ncbi:MAG: RNA recognition motif domain-containing protein [Polyangiaceae bacterium]
MSAHWTSNVARFDHVFVGSLPPGTTEDELRAAFASGGTEVGNITLVRSRATGLFRGFAFIALLARFDVGLDPRALDRMASTTMRGRPLVIQAVPLRPRRVAYS